VGMGSSRAATWAGAFALVDCYPAVVRSVASNSRGCISEPNIRNYHCIYRRSMGFVQLCIRQLALRLGQKNSMQPIPGSSAV
jgi:hypothetical protein